MPCKVTVCVLVFLGSFVSCAHVFAQDDGSNGASESQEGASTARALQLEEALTQIDKVLTNKPSAEHHQRAEILFRLGRFTESVEAYDKAVEFGRPHNSFSCWERGLAQYYAGDFKAGSDQFAGYHTVGSSDIENGLWRFLCIAEEEGIEKARETMFEYPRKVRKPFPALLALFMDQGTKDAVMAEAQQDVSSPKELTNRLFYAHYYLGKYYEIMDDKENALLQFREALDHRISHFMYYCAEADAERQKCPEK